MAQFPTPLLIKSKTHPSAELCGLMCVRFFSSICVPDMGLELPNSCFIRDADLNPLSADEMKAWRLSATVH